MLHLATGGDPVAFDRTGRAALEAQERAPDVIDFDLALTALPVGPLFDHCHAVAHDLSDRPGRGAHQELGRSQRVAADVGERAAAGGVMAKCEGPDGVRHIILGMNAAIAADFAEFARRDHVARER